MIERAVSKDPAERYPTRRRADRGGARARGRDAGRDPGALRRAERPTAVIGAGGAGARWRRPVSARLARGAGQGPGCHRRRDPRRDSRRLRSGQALRRRRRLRLRRRSRSADGPLRLAVGDGAVWVTSAADGTLSGSIPTRREVDWRALQLGRGVSGVAVGRGLGLGLSPRDGEVLRVDPDTPARS